MTTARLTKRRTTLEKHRSEVLDMLLDGAKPADIAKRHKVSIEAVMKFQQRHAETINTQVAAAEEKADIHRVSRKAYRIGEMQGLYDTSKAEINLAEDTSGKVAAIKTALSILHAAAEELGQLPRPDQNINLRAQVLIRELKGANPEELG